ncbi:hypothetical protein Poly24_36050 [Rosistilla carotiformis]|uniref:Uncharacterized protein n=1 Tax=Rosistilla carotiformis TaxID=2528017 RepID=A0A518JWG9_9BACT|nr:hypothetical protein [Rosistilla carotiformis]QDV69887.1 hypothetical protein Poly24_36050 [Rosistilla carotiformis]
MDDTQQTPPRWVEIEFDCLPLRTVQRVDVPLDASPRFEAFVLRVKQAIQEHGVMNTYYLHNARCTFHFTNDPSHGMVQFKFEGTVFTNATDTATISCHLDVQPDGETCDWLNEAVMRWLAESVRHALVVEFDRYIQAGDLSKAAQRIEQIQAESDAAEGYLGMYL